MKHRALSFAFLSLLTVACGRSDLDEDLPFSRALDGGMAIEVPASRDAGRDASDAAKPDVTPPPHDAAVDVGACPSNCDDGVACTVDGCDPAKGTCTHRPDDSLCPDGLLCDGVSGCTKLVYASTFNSLYAVTLPTGALRLITNRMIWSSDIALSPDGTLYAIDGNINVIDRFTGNALRKIPESGLGDSPSLESDLSGNLYAMKGYTDVARIDPRSGQLTTVASLPDGYESSGDFAFLNGRLLGTVKSGFGSPSDELADIDIVSGGTTILGRIGFACVWGLATFQSQLWGFTCHGEMITIDPTTAKGTLVANVGIPFNGAASR